LQGRESIAAFQDPSHGPHRSKADAIRINDEIRVPMVRLVDQEGTMVGVVSREEALSKAGEVGLDLVEISPQSDPPVCKILDFGRFKFEQQKKKTEARKNQKITEVKEVQMRPMIDEHDLQVKCRAIHRFLEAGDKIKIVLRFRGRELDHQDIGMNLLMRVRDQFDKMAKVDQMPKLEGRQMIMVFSPKSDLEKPTQPR
jgi:translation initiation factor IF-3